MSYKHTIIISIITETDAADDIDTLAGILMEVARSVGVGYTAGINPNYSWHLETKGDDCGE